MKLLKQNYSWLFVLLVMVFFVCARAGSIAHATSYGSAPHNHDGKICVLSVLANEDDDLDELALPPKVVGLAKPIFHRPIFNGLAEDDTSVQFVKPSARSPPAK